MKDSITWRGDEFLHCTGLDGCKLDHLQGLTVNRLEKTRNLAIMTVEDANQQSSEWNVESLNLCCSLRIHSS